MSRKHRATEALENEEKIQAACDAYRAGTYCNMFATAKACGVSYPSMRRRLEGITRPRHLAHENQMLLSLAQESVLCEWLIYLGASGHPVSKRSISPKVHSLCGTMPSKDWISSFLIRNPGVVLGRSTGLDPKRACAFNRTTVDHHLTLLQEYLEKYEIPWENVYNMDEKGIQLGGGRRGTPQKFFYSRSEKVKLKIQSGELELVTIIEVVCADGSSSIKPGFVFSGVKMREEWFCEDDIVVATSENGWTSDFICTEWFKQLFIPSASARNVSGKPVLLIYDGHGSHVQLEMIDVALKSNIHLFCLPPHTTHRLQPLDVGIFGPLQRAWFDRCDLILEQTGETMQTRDVVKEYMAARKGSFKPETILNAWHRSGMNPIDPTVFKESDFAPSYSTSTITHLPPSFPTRFPPMPDASSDDVFDPATFHIKDNVEEVEDLPEGDGDLVVSSDSETASVAVLTVTPTPSPAGKIFRRTRSVSQVMGAQRPLPDKRSSCLGCQSLLAELEEMRIQRDAAETHAIIMQRQFAVVQHQLNAKIARADKSSRPLHTKSRVVTSEAGRAEIAAIHAEQLQKEQANEEKLRKKAEAAAQTTARRMAQGTDVEFKGRLQSRNKEGLQDIAHALCISLEGTIATLIERVNNHFAMHPELKDDKRFTGLFAGHTRGKKCPLPEDDDPTDNPAALPAQRQRQCLQDVVNLSIPTPNH